ncbi:hypothetical protein, partial [Pseudomonas rhodesiae]|uniref:hypothetical protein n=1 Tax=Pseudomonas rhodesiae TaxID=76760 RepID=UPI002B1DC458
MYISCNRPRGNHFFAPFFTTTTTITAAAMDATAALDFLLQDAGVHEVEGKPLPKSRCDLAPIKSFTAIPPDE